MRAQQRGKIQFHHVAFHDGDIPEFGQRLRQKRRQPPVDLNCHNLARAAGQLLRQHTKTGADLQHAHGAVEARGLGNFGADAGVDDEVLPQPFGKRKSVRGAKRPNGGKIRQFHAACYTSGSGGEEVSAGAEESVPEEELPEDALREDALREDALPEEL